MEEARPTEWRTSPALYLCSIHRLATIILSVTELTLEALLATFTDGLVSFFEESKMADGSSASQL